ncbi:hypothetical protein BN2476_960053 [Paraburkholderia piptadeniae]|uniref:Uncharacterized protein n=1 Tax=Paraburkholderia piptadeniae TaxID=1701573 RepID=A0A1N7SU90_9BURK|nr:hypothetical protein BN2476_960053 [Paraburkholderia piptadeniae]
MQVCGQANWLEILEYSPSIPITERQWPYEGPGCASRGSHMEKASQRCHASNVSQIGVGAWYVVDVDTRFNAVGRKREQSPVPSVRGKLL